MRPMRRHVLPVLALAAFLTGAAPAMGAERHAGVDDDRGPAEPADAAVRRVDRRARGGRPDDHDRPVAAVPADRRLRRLDHRLVGPPAGQVEGPRRDHARPVRHRRRDRPELPAPADGRQRLRQGPALHLRRHAEGQDRLRHGAVLRRPRREADPAAAAPGAAPQPQPEGDGHAVEPAGVDEGPRVAGRRPLHRRQALLRRLHEVLREVRRRPTSAPACRSTR